MTRPRTITLDDLEGAFNRAPSLDTAQAWLDSAIEEFKRDNIQLPELQSIGAAVRVWCRANQIKVPD